MAEFTLNQHLILRGWGLRSHVTGDHIEYILVQGNVEKCRARSPLTTRGMRQLEQIATNAGFEDLSATSSSDLGLTLKWVIQRFPAPNASESFALWHTYARQHAGGLEAVRAKKRVTFAQYIEGIEGDEIVVHKRAKGVMAMLPDFKFVSEDEDGILLYASDASPAASDVAEEMQKLLIEAIESPIAQVSGEKELDRASSVAVEDPSTFSARFKTAYATDVNHMSAEEKKQFFIGVGTPPGKSQSFATELFPEGKYTLSEFLSLAKANANKVIALKGQGKGWDAEELVCGQAARCKSQIRICGDYVEFNRSAKLLSLGN